MSKELAISQNKVDELAGDKKYDDGSFQDIMLDLVNEETSKSRKLISNNLIKSFKMHNIDLIKNPSRSANFKVLKALDFPSVLIELGYLSNNKDKVKICTTSWQDKMASAIYQAVDNFRTCKR